MEEYKAHREELPPLLKKIPVVASIDGSILGQPAVATLRIRAVNGRFKYEARHLSNNEVMDKSEYIREVCADDNRIQIKLQNEEVYEALLTDGGFKFKKNFLLYIDFISNESEFRRVAKKLDDLQPSRSMPSPVNQKSGAH